MGERRISQKCLETAGFSYTLSLVNGKYTMTLPAAPAACTSAAPAKPLASAHTRFWL